jgi:subtilisin family serine protease
MTSRVRARTAAVAGAAAIAGFVLVGASSAAAEEPVPGDWYFDVFGVQESLDAGNDGAGVHIAVIDGQFNPEVPTLQGADLTIAPSICYDDAGVQVPSETDAPSAAHGTNSVSLIVGTGAGYPGQTGVRGAAPRAQVTAYSVGANEVVEGLGEIPGVECSDEQGERLDVMNRRIEQALDDGADIISIQIASSIVDRELVARAMREGVIVLQGLDNEFVFESDDSTLGLAQMNGVVGVQAIDAYGDPQNGAGSTDLAVDIAAPGVGMTAQGGQQGESWDTQSIQSGTSNATPFTAGVLAAAWSKYPEASGNQIIQSMIRNTGLEDHELARDDSLGYGIISLRHMLQEDPTQYDDVNPLIIDDREFVDQQTFADPRYEEIFPDTATPAPTESPNAGSGLGALLPALIIGGVVGLLVLAGLIVLIVVLVTRKTR